MNLPRIRLIYGRFIFIHNVDLYKYFLSQQLIRSTVLHSFDMAENMTLSTVHILGVEESVTRVKIGGVDVDYTYAESTKKVITEYLYTFEYRVMSTPLSCSYWSRT